jgi:hypothetical protein
MFDLEQCIVEWRQEMLAAGIKTPAPLEELEVHLREEIRQQIQSGTNEREAFEIAIQRVGQANALNCEFKKISVQEIMLLKIKNFADVVFLVLMTFIVALTLYFGRWRPPVMSLPRNAHTAQILEMYNQFAGRVLWRTSRWCSNQFVFWSFYRCVLFCDSQRLFKR